MALRNYGASALFLGLLLLQKGTALQVLPEEYGDNGQMPAGVYDERFAYLPVETVQNWGMKHSPFKGRAPPRGDMKELAGHFTGRKYFSSAYRYQVPELRFNPALIVLPDTVARELGNGAHYLATLRHNNGQCHRLGNSIPTVNRSDRRVDSSVVVLDSNFDFVASTPISGTDCRLLVDGERVYITRVTFPGATHLASIKLTLNGLALHVAFVDDKPFPVGDRNLGLLKYDGNLMLLRWPAEHMDMQKLRNSAGGESELHNSVNPLELPELNVFLGVGHMHLGNGCRGCPKKRGAKYGHSYVHHFVLFSRGEPWAMQHLSPPFCIPSAADASMCETIQFVTSIIREGEDLLVTYGINDCEAAMVRVPLQAVLKFTRESDEGQPLSESLLSGARMRVSSVR